MLTFRRRFEPRTAIVKHADSTGFGQFEIALLRANGIEDRRHGPSRRVIGHLLVRPIGVNDGMLGGPGKVLLDACCREEQRLSDLVAGGDNSCRPLGEELLRCRDVGPDVELWRAGRLSTGGLEPDLTIILDLAIDAAAERRSRTQPDRLERRDRTYHERVRQGFLTEARRQPERFRIIDAGGTIENVQALIRAAVEPLLAARN